MYIVIKTWLQGILVRGKDSQNPGNKSYGGRGAARQKGKTAAYRRNLEKMPNVGRKRRGDAKKRRKVTLHKRFHFL